MSPQNIDCRYSLEPPHRGGSNEYPQSMFLSRNKKYNVHPSKPQFYYIKLGFKGVKIIYVCFRDVFHWQNQQKAEVDQEPDVLIFIIKQVRTKFKKVFFIWVANWIIH